MSIARELLESGRADAFLITAETTAAQLKKMDLRLVQSFKRSGDTLEVKFVDIAKLCEIADREEAVAREQVAAERGEERLRGIVNICGEAYEGAAE